jgi:hypothetical protein
VKSTAGATFAAGLFFAMMGFAGGAADAGATKASVTKGIIGANRRFRRVFIQES